MNELKKRINEIREEMRDEAKKQTDDYLIARLEGLKEKILFDFQRDKEKFEDGKISEERFLILEEQTFYFVTVIKFWISTIKQEKSTWTDIEKIVPVTQANSDIDLCESL